MDANGRHQAVEITERVFDLEVAEDVAIGNNKERWWVAIAIEA